MESLTNKFSELKLLLDDQGYTNPLCLNNLDNVERLREKFRREEPILRKALIKAKLGLKGRQLNAGLNRHLDIPLFQDIIYDESFISTLKHICSQHLILWRTIIFRKQVGSQMVGWHHDKHFQNGTSKYIDLNEISSHFTAIIALSDMTLTNGAFQVLPKSHKPLKGLERDLRIFTEKNLEDHILPKLPQHLEDMVETLTLKQGQFIIFHSALLHRSLEYISGNPRTSITLRFITPDVEFLSNRFTTLKSHQLLHV